MSPRLDILVQEGDSMMRTSLTMGLSPLIESLASDVENNVVKGCNSQLRDT